MELTRREVMALYAAIGKAGDLRDADGRAPHLKFSYALGKTKRALQAEVETIDELQVQQQRERRTMAEACALRGEDGHPIAYDTGVKLRPDKVAEFNAFADRQFDDLSAFFKASVSVDVHQVAWDHVPALTPELVDGLWPIFLGEPPSQNGTEPKK